MLVTENDGNIDIHLTCKNREIWEKRKKDSVIYRFYQLTKRSKLLTRFNKVYWKQRVKNRISLLLVYELITRVMYTAKNDTKSKSEIKSIKKWYLRQLSRDEFPSLLKIV